MSLNSALGKVSTNNMDIIYNTVYCHSPVIVFGEVDHFSNDLLHIKGQQGNVADDTDTHSMLLNQLPAMKPSLSMPALHCTVTICTKEAR